MSPSRKLVVAAILLLTASVAVGQGPSEYAPGVQDLINDTQATVRVDQTNGLAKFAQLPVQPVQSAAPVFGAPSAPTAVGGRLQQPAAGVQAMNFFRDYGSAFGVAQADTELASAGIRRDGYGNQHAVFQQIHEGVPVFGGELRAHINARGQLYAVNGDFVTNIKVDTTASLTSDEAGARAIRTVIGQQIKRGQVARRQAGEANPVSEDDFEDLVAAATRLIVFRAGLVMGAPGHDHLAYEVEVRNEAVSIREFVYVDAHSGKVIDQITGIHEAIDREVHEVTYPNLVWMEGDAFPTGNMDWDNEIDGAGETYNLFASMTAGAYLSFDGADATMITVNNAASVGCPNATWNGFSTNYCTGVTGDDTVAHEWGHAYTDFTNDLIYQWQSGALNESYSDIWGEVVDLLNGRGTDAPGGPRTAGNCSTFGAGAPSVDPTYRWLSGEDDPAFGGAIRDMWNPNCYGDPGGVTDGSYWCGTGDSGGVHINSGIPNHAFALMVDGGTYNGVTVGALGLTKASHIHWAAQNLLTQSSNFVDHADALEAACTSLLGIDLPTLSTSTTSAGPSGEIISGADCAEVSSAIAAVEFRTSPDFCGFAGLLDPDAPELCEGLGTEITFVVRDFEDGALPAGWSVGTHDVVNPGTFDNPGWTVVSGLPAGNGSDYAAFVPDLNAGDCVTDIEAGALYMETPPIPLPPGVVPHVAFDHWVATEAGWDGGNLKLSVNGGPFEVVPSSAISFNSYNDEIIGGGNDNPLAGEEAFTGSDEGSVGGSWGQTQVNLFGLAFPGDTVIGRFDFGVDGCFGTIGWYVDNVRLYACSDEEPPICGDGQLFGLTEACDDGNMADGDGCSSSCEVEDGWICEDPTPGSSGANVVDDGSFEAGPLGGTWSEFSTNFGTPICNVGSCGTGTGTGPSDGDFWTWFGGISAFEQGFVFQDVTIPPTATDLTFDLEQIACDSGDDYMSVLVDGNLEFFTDGSSGLCGTLGYSQQTVDVSGYADGGLHELAFISEIFATNGGVSNFFVDNVVLSDNVSASGDPSVCTRIVEDLACFGGTVAYDDGIAPSWTVLDNEGTGLVWTDIASSDIGGNWTGGGGEAASVNSDAFAFVEFDTELRSNSFSLDGATAASLDYLVNYQNLAALDFLDVDVSTDGGANWTNVLSWNEDHPVGGLFSAPGEAVSIDLGPFAGESDVQVRWHYYDPNFGDWDWYAQVDDVSVACECEDAGPSLVGHWKFDENTGIDAFDSSGFGNDAKLKSQPSPGGGVSGAGVPEWTMGHTGAADDYALAFDGSNGYVNAFSDSSLDNLSSLTYTAWVKRGADGDLEIFSKQSSYHEMRFKGAGVLRGCIVGNLKNACSDSVELVPLDTWTHVAMTYDHAGDKKVHLFINGSEVTYAAQSTAKGQLKSDKGSNQNLGRRTNNTRYYEGTLDDMRIYNTALSECNIRELATRDLSFCGDCLENNGTPGCENAGCQAEICAIDPYCCDVEWDSICANGALDFCVPDICYG